MQTAHFYRLKSTSVFLAASFLLHLIWENTQAPLFVGYTSFTQHFWACFKATWGDLLLMLIIYAALAFIHRDAFWFVNRTAYDHIATWMIAVLLGVLLAVSFELWAVHVAHRWGYTPSMPLLPVVQIGLTPVLQMIIVPLLTLYVTKGMTSKTT